DRKEMARIAFSSAKNLRALNSIVHPEIIRRIRAAINKARADRLPVLIVDAALLHELGLEGLVDRLVVLDAPEYLRKDRMLASGKMDKETLENLIDLQLPIPVEKLRSRGHLVIENRGDMEALRKSALEVFDSLAEGK
ncbi:MAG: dephospho-CoA kinase, partial [Gemmatimonadota bacterium]|nr:dephospho-CoA kinase [Gemmatimonadota bacterium]